MEMENSKPKKNLSSKLENFFKAKYPALIISLLLMICGILAIGIGAIRLGQAIISMIGILEERPGFYLIESVDALLFALVILVLSGGIFKLFIGSEDTFKESGVFSKLNNFIDLKILLWETLLLTLTVWCALGFFVDPKDLNYEQLILPVSILLLALALKFVKSENH